MARPGDVSPSIAASNKEPDVPARPAEANLPVRPMATCRCSKSRDSAGKLTAVLFGYACHATVLDGYDWCERLSRFCADELRRPSIPGLHGPVLCRLRRRSKSSAAPQGRAGSAVWPRPGHGGRLRGLPATPHQSTAISPSHATEFDCRWPRCPIGPRSNATPQSADRFMVAGPRVFGARTRRRPIDS